MTKDRLWDTPEGRARHQMLNATTNPRNPHYATIGGKGITMCDRWLEDPRNILEDMGPCPGPDYELRRIDKPKGYNKSNCRWVKRQNLTFRGRRQTIVAWAEEVGMKYSTLWMRLFVYRWAPTRALTKPVRGLYKPLNHIPQRHEV